jgi:hypothetical protein
MRLKSAMSPILIFVEVGREQMTIEYELQFRDGFSTTLTHRGMSQTCCSAFGHRQDGQRDR